MIACLSLQAVLPQTQSQLLDLCVTWDQSDWLTSRPWDLTKHQCPLLGVSLALSVLGVYFSYETPLPWLLHGRVWLWPSIFCLLSWPLEFWASALPANLVMGPKCLLLAAISYRMVWPPDHEVCGALPATLKVSPTPDGCWAILLTPWGRACSAHVPVLLLVILCCWAVLSRSVVSNFLQPVLVPVFILLINLTGVHFPDSDPYRTNLPTACQTLTLYLRGEISVEFSNPIPWLKTVFIMSKQKPLARIAHPDLYCLLHYGKYMHA